MKAIIAVAATLLLVQKTHACAGGFIPDYIFLNISNSPHVDQATRDHANFTYWHTRQLVHQRGSAGSGGDGITDSDDDSNFDFEQDPNDAAALEQEEEAVLAADEQTPDPDSVEPVGASRRVRRGPMRRQSGSANRFVYQNSGSCQKNPPTALVRKEGTTPAVDSLVNSVYDGFGAVHNLYKNVYGRNGINGAGSRMHGIVHYCQQFNNAIWDGNLMAFGDADGRIFTRFSFARDLSVIGHEITHGVIQYTNPLRYYGQAGALNEHIADVFGILTEQYSRGQTAQSSDWLIGRGIVVGGRALRSFSAPGTAYNTPALGKDPQPGSMANFYNGYADNAGVHINSGIPNRAFYLFATSVGGYAWNAPGQIWYNVLAGRQGSFNFAGETFGSFAQRTLNAAGSLYGTNVANQLRTAWRQVGVL